MFHSLFLLSLLVISALSGPVPEEAAAESSAAPASGEKFLNPKNLKKNVFFLLLEG